MATDIATLGLKIRSDGVIVASKRLRTMDAAAKKVDRTTKRLNSTFMKMRTILLGFVGIAIFTGMIKIMANFEERMSTVKAVVTQNETEFAALSAAARKMGATTRFSATEAAEGIIFLGRAGLKTTQIVATLPNALNLAIAANIELGRSSDILTNVMSAFGVEASESAQIADVLANATNNANTNIEQLAEALKPVGPIAKALNKDLISTASALSVLANRGIQGSIAGRGLRRVLSALASTKVDKKLREIGTSFEALNPAIKTYLEIATELERVQLSAGDAFKVFGQFGAPVVLIMKENAAEMKKLEDIMRNSTLTAKEMANIMSDNLTGDFKALVSTIQEVVLKIGSSGLLGVFRSLIQTSTQVIRILTGISDGLSANESFASKVTTAIKILTIVMGSYLALQVATKMFHAALAFYKFAKAIGTAAKAMIFLDKTATIATGGVVKIATKVALLLGAAALGFKILFDEADKMAAARKAEAEALEKLIGKNKKNTSSQSASLTMGFKIIAQLAKLKIQYKMLGNEYGTTNKSALKYAESIGLLSLLESKNLLVRQKAWRDLNALHDAYELATGSIAQMRSKVRELSNENLLLNSKFEMVMKSGKALRKETIEMGLSLGLVVQTINRFTLKPMLMWTKEGQKHLINLDNEFERLADNKVLNGFLARQNPFKPLQVEADSLMRLLDDGRINAQQFGAEMERLSNIGTKLEIKRFEASKTATDGITAGLMRVSEAGKVTGKTVSDSIVKGFKSAEDAMVEFAMTGKFEFKKMADSMIKDLIRILIRMQITSKIATAIAGINWGGTPDLNPNAHTSPAPGSPGTGLHSYAHSGGVVGRLSSFKHVNPGVFAGAQRFHSGGLVTGEVPIIARKGERVVPEGGMNGTVNITIINETGAGVEVQEGKRAGGQRDIKILISQAIAADIIRGGPAAKAIQTAFGARPTIGGR